MSFRTIWYKPLYLRIFFVLLWAFLIFGINYLLFIRFSLGGFLGILRGWFLLWRFISKQKYLYEITQKSCTIHVWRKKTYKIPLREISSFQVLADNWKVTFFPSFWPDTVFRTSSWHNLVCLHLKNGKNIIISPRRMQEFTSFLKSKISTT